MRNHPQAAFHLYFSKIERLEHEDSEKDVRSLVKFKILLISEDFVQH